MCKTGVAMAGQSNAPTVIIKRKKIINAGGHHGGAWKVAYADFVTAMMAFFMLMWLLGATTEKQRKGIADYFSPTIPINRVSGGGEGAFGGESVLAEQTLSKHGVGATSDTSKPSSDANSEETRAAAAELRQALESKLLARTGESMTMERIMRHVVTKVTDEGLVIELFDLPEAELFARETAEPSSTLNLLAEVIADVLKAAENELALNGHVRSYPLILQESPAWPLSTERAKRLREALLDNGLDDRTVQRTSGFADRKPAVANPTAQRNNRLEIVLLRSDR